MLGSLCLMGSPELVGGVASLHFSGARGSWLTGRTEWERRDCARLPAANSGKVEDSRHVRGGALIVKNSLNNCRAVVCHLANDSWADIRSCFCHHRG